MVSRLVKAAVVAAVLVLIINSLPDIKRYLKIRDMLTPCARRQARHVA